MINIEDNELESVLGALNHAESKSKLKENVVSSLNGLGLAALSYAAKGWPVLPLKAGGKRRTGSLCLTDIRTLRLIQT